MCWEWRRVSVLAARCPFCFFTAGRRERQGLDYVLGVAQGDCAIMRRLKVGLYLAVGLHPVLWCWAVAQGEHLTAGR